ncbi:MULTISPECIES: Spo0E family sporulation regulatory protein-aspartic acid phosphatase [unclassified Candidatus Frackibacter]|uniref:Spo0E family sporulation regulatory protein-aspartic acid phosphatase n=1 Tax=unclassified Candidatus Frackibacter TaxID=2648818 RepID=UPI000791DBF0|nr:MULTISPECIES: Spo0E family sporulation regulatory protein-aspartic acid phosphatase [unclassified Candidatus Frackibacter]KXS44936.1 MAG: hypothetical protein AWU54_640 [Candidatus Frackibacter sp. T328-2]SDB97154.1 Spo0E like sporulation regulatory protein [Candidatus Frackibacter sp. WG11]SEM28810.1 Spo0E like sporulation regulatory protein [Candidatus Frackibacter sp. WG12]SFL33658.1 Spo0E like sporulation regulatory protein [Candidatus Frackibacter sp. WG13]
MLEQIKKQRLSQEISELRSKLNQYEANFTTANLKEKVIDLSRTLDEKIIAYQRLTKNK